MVSRKKRNKYINILKKIGIFTCFITQNLKCKLETKKDNLWALDVCRQSNPIYMSLKRQKDKQHKLPFVNLFKD